MKGYTVTLGFETVTVETTSREEALKLGRRALVHRWPRLYDMIMGASDEKFVIESIP